MHAAPGAGRSLGTLRQSIPQYATNFFAFCNVILEDRAGAIAAVEVKASASMRPSDWRTLARLRDARDKRFRCGVILHTGESTVPLSDRIFAVPISGLWA
jgi:hypothetical protein